MEVTHAASGRKWLFPVAAWVDKAADKAFVSKPQLLTEGAPLYGFRVWG